MLFLGSKLDEFLSFGYFLWVEENIIIFLGLLKIYLHYFTEFFFK